MGTPKRLYLESLRVGDELPTLVKPPIERVQIVRYAGASNDFNPLHVDEVAAKSAGMPTIYAHALLPMGFMGQFMSDWLRGGRMTRLAVRFVKLVWPSDMLSCKGRVLSRRRDEQGHYYVDVDLWAENQKGELVLKGHATGQVYFNAEDEARQRRGETPLVADVSEQSELPRNAKGKPVKPKPATPVAVRPAPAAAPAASPIFAAPPPPPSMDPSRFVKQPVAAPPPAAKPKPAAPAAKVARK